MTFYYRPTVNEVFDSVQYITTEVNFVKRIDILYFHYIDYNFNDRLHRTIMKYMIN